MLQREKIGGGGEVVVVGGGGAKGKKLRRMIHFYMCSLVEMCACC